ncbi:NAD-dependent epimerase/dehydratase family protein [Paenibacillus kobensis]|uniref:NAD-dependent epimerase/dehydratase family protein n=1 Tax=Paenibacillus kobensis TaxID=59841 RepID=UPI000FD7CC22|nr:NAD(P)-dependent oxidoreductase [Paenibacillus kobensis]
MNKKRVLLSGANGYIALHLANWLRNNNYHVLTAARDGSGDLHMDFSRPNQVATDSVSGIDAMIHTVSPNETLYKTDTYSALSESVTGIHAALDFCTHNEIRKFIYISSFHVMGNQSGRLSELSPIAPHNDYGLAHAIAEQTVQMYNRIKQLDGWVIRPSNVFGVPADRDKFKRWNLIPFLFCREAIERGTITLLTTGSQLRNFVGVTDVCRNIQWILDNEPAERIIHAYGQDTLSVYQYALLVQKVARERYGRTVSIIRPEGSNSVSEFEFTSCCSIPELAPRDNLETFVMDMLGVYHDLVSTNSF